MDNETWLLEAGAAIIEKKAAQGYASQGYASLSPMECLTYCLWVADYGMRNAGDLATAGDLYPPFMRDAKSAAERLGFPHAIAAFSLSPSELEQRYFGLFDEIVGEIRAARHGRI